MDEVLDHGIGDLEIGDHPVFHRPNGFQFIVGPAVHSLGLQTYGYRFPVSTVAIIIGDRDDGWLVKDNPLIFDIDQRVGGAQVHGYIGYKIIGKIFKKIPNHEHSLRIEWFWPRRFQSISSSRFHQWGRRPVRIRTPTLSWFLPR